MRTDRGFLLSFYLSLALSGACLGYVTLATHPTQVFLLGGPIGLVLVVAYFLEGRWALTTFKATVVGLGMAASAGVWFAGFFVRLSGAETEAISWPVLLLPQMGFWLMLLTLVKLFRPKAPGDFWALHLMGFAGVALAASLDSDFLLSFLLFAYLACVLWSLACFYQYRENLLASQSRQPNQNASATVPAASAAPAPLPWRWLGVFQAVRRAAVILLLVVVFYLLTPRHSVSSWEESLFRSASLQTGLGDSVIDLNRTGTIRTSTAVAFAVKAETADGEPKLDLDPNQRWRGLMLNQYDSGRWSSIPINWTDPAAPYGPIAPRAGETSGVLPDFGPEEYFIEFHFSIWLYRLPVVAEPADTHPDKAVPLVFFALDKSLSGRRHTDGELRGPVELPKRGAHCNSYRQVCIPVREPTVSLPVPADMDFARSYCRLPSLPELSPWVGKVLRSLADQGQLASADLQRDRQGRLLPQNHEKVARALEAYLCNSGKYTYSLNLPRQDRNVDPIVDFLCNVKQGHCERFASGLAIMLRSQGIPARMIAGFRGAEHQGNGVYHVRQNHAHAWVEALIERRGPTGRPERRWLTLDPTPSEDAEVQSLSGLARWWREFTQRGGTVWRNYVVDYNADQQDLVLGDLFGRLSLRSLFGGPLVYLGVRAYHRRRAASDKADSADRYVAFYAAWLTVLSRRCGIEPGRGQTAQEFASDLAERLQKLPKTAGLQDMPIMMANLYYRVRFAALPLSEPEQQEVEADMKRFDLVLASLGPQFRSLSEPAVSL